MIKNVPHTIPYKEELIIDGETIIDWNTFNDINDKLPKGQEKYKHPRNLVSGSLNVLDTKVADSRNMRFIAWRIIKGLNDKSVFFALKEAEKLGFEIVPMWTYTNKFILYSTHCPKCNVLEKKLKQKIFHMRK